METLKRGDRELAASNESVAIVSSSSSSSSLSLICMRPFGRAAVDSCIASIMIVATNRSAIDSATRTSNAYDAEEHDYRRSLFQMSPSSLDKVATSSKCSALRIVMEAGASVSAV